VFPPGWYSTTLLLDPDSTDLRIAALRFGADIPAPAGTAARFTLSAPVVLADLDFTGLALDGEVLEVDTVITGSTLDGQALVVTV
jgi:hypothetical protein